MFKVGDIVKAKQGMKDPDFEDSDISDWQGKIIEVCEPDKESGEPIFLIEWDNTTLNQMSDEFLERTDEEGYYAEEMYLGLGDIEAAEERPEEELIERDYEFDDDDDDDYSFDEDDEFIIEIIGDEDLDVNEEKLHKFLEYFNANFDFSTVVTGIEDFPWEERYVLGFGDKDEYRRLKKTRPSYRDLYKIMKVEDEIILPQGLFVKVKRLSDRQFFSLPLVDLKTNDENSPHYALLDAYSIWVVNYSG